MTSKNSTIRAMDFFTDPTPFYREWHEHGPMQIDSPDGSQPWMIARYDDVVQALSHPGLSSAVIPSGMVIHLDPPDHTQLRKPIARAFSARRMEVLRPRIEQITDTLLDAWGAEEVDVIDTFAFPLPITVISELLGVPEEDRETLRDLTARLMKPASNLNALMDLHEYAQRLIETKEPGDDLITELRDEPNLASTIVLLITAGHETTVQLIGNGLFALLRHPETMRALIDDPSLLPDAVDELLRYDGPFALGLPRIATTDVEIGGVTIPAGAYVNVSMGAANRDPSRFPDPDTLKLGRDPHVGFGHGIHFCVGARLARIEGEIAFGAVLRRFPELRLADEPEWRTGIIRGLASFRVRPKP